MPRAPSSRSIARLPQTPETWLVAVAQLRTWIVPPNESPHRPYGIFVFNLNDGAMMALDAVDNSPATEEIRDSLFKAMAKPRKALGPARRPGTIIVQPGRAEAFRQVLADTPLGITVVEQAPPDEFWNIVRELESFMREGRPELTALLSMKDVTPELAGSVYAAAFEFYRAGPWVQLDNSQILAVRHPAEPKPRFVSVMGNGGVEYGLAIYLRWEDVERMHMAVDDPLEALPDAGAHSLSYGPINEVPFDDLDALEKYGWAIAAEDAYPVPIIYDKSGGARRPDLIDMLWYEAALRAIPAFVRDHLRSDGQGDYAPAEATIEVATHSGPVKVDVKYPAGKLPLDQFPAQDAEWEDFDEEEDEEDELPFVDRRAMEGVMAQIIGEARGEFAPGNPELERAQQMMYQAWDETNPAKRIGLAHTALSISPDCTDAYVLLAEEEADTVGRALEYYQKGVAAGERALGQKYFRDFAGHFWGLVETRPYMRAREGLAQTLWRVNRKEESIDHYRELLRLNANDNQGVRYVLLELLLQLDRDDEAARLIRKYRGDWSSAWMYTRALLEFRKGGACATARSALGRALDQNRHVPTYLIGHKRIPNRLPDYIRPGDVSEAVSYSAHHLNHWRRTPGAIDWLKRQVAETSARRPGSPAKARRTPRSETKSRRAR